MDPEVDGRADKRDQRGRRNRDDSYSGMACKGSRVHLDMEPFFKTELGALYQGDCTPLLRQMIGNVQADLIFCDPPFNLDKKYGDHVDDDRIEGEYADWLREWLIECIDVLAPGGSIMVYNLPKWNIVAAGFLATHGLDLIDWIAVRVTQGFPRSKGLYRGHYGIIHFTFGRPRVLNKIRVPIETCRHCHGELRDYGGHRSKMSDAGVSVSDIWTDIPTVRHAKYKTPGWHGPQLSTKLVRRCILLTTNPGDVVLDPMAGSGTVPAVCEAEGRRWVAIEKGDCSIIQARIEQKNTAFHNSFDRVDLDITSKIKKHNKQKQDQDNSLETNHSTWQSLAKHDDLIQGSRYEETRKKW